MLENIVRKLRIIEEYDYNDEGDWNEEEEQEEQRPTKKKSSPDKQVYISKPKKLEDVKEIIHHLLQGEQVIINLEKMPPREKQRLMDMVAGCCYCNHQVVKEVNQDVYIIGR